MIKAKYLVIIQVHIGGSSVALLIPNGFNIKRNVFVCIYSAGAFFEKSIILNYYGENRHDLSVLA